MRFPVDIATSQLRGGTRQTVAFFETSSGDLLALRGNERIVASDFEELMAVLLKEGPCDFRIPTELAWSSNSLDKKTGIVRLSISLDCNQFANRDTFTVHAQVESDGQLLGAGEPVSDAYLGSAIEKSLAGIARLRTVIPQRCFFCRFSDYEPHTSVGNLKCYLEESAAYCDAAAQMASNSGARYQIFRLLGAPVDDLGTCDAFEIRPMNWGYRG